MKMYLWVSKHSGQQIGIVKGFDVFEFFTLIEVVERDIKK